MDWRDLVTAIALGAGLLAGGMTLGVLITELL